MVDKKAKVDSLVEQILYHKRAYYSGQPVISDASYDRLEDELRTLVPTHPVLELVGTGEAADAEKVPHDPPMLSLAKTYDLEELFAWVKGRGLVGTFKVDGVALSLVYKNGDLSLAKTRGNGRFGEDVTAKIRWVSDCPGKLQGQVPSPIEVRGELYCSEGGFARLMGEMETLGLEKPTNPRNIVAGILGRKQHVELARYFQFFAFDAVVKNETKLFHTEREKFSWLSAHKFKLIQVEFLDSKESITAYLQKAKDFWEDGDVGIDGVVFTYDDLSTHEQLGATSHHPRYKMSFKWPGQTAVVTIKHFKWLTSRFGIVTPVAVIDPVYLSGAQISNVTLHNAAYVKLFNLKAGDTIEIIRSGEVIPKFLQLVKAADGNFAFPSKCPSCDSVLTFDEVRLVCPNRTSCPAQRLGSILNWIRYAEIDDLSEKRLQAMIDLGLIEHMSDLYRLKEEDLLKLPLTKEKMARKLFNNIQKSKNLSLPHFLGGLGIEGMGRTSWEALLQNFPSLDKIVNLLEVDILQVEGFAEKTAQQIVSGLKAKKEDIHKLFAVGVRPIAFEPRKVESGVLKGKTFVLTGALSQPRDEIVKKIEKAGGKVVSAVSMKVTAIITNETSSSSTKAKQARELSISFWSEEELEKHLRSLDDS
ncbi:MAG: NAD-dependent DNA ligase LigA [Deltaproteobacteria bacterium]|nr:NAD-dependent DNA ligase LigA [Deltaproteobacteria bacterium]